MSEVKSAFISVGEHPLRHVADQIWGINIVRTAHDLAEAPPSVAEAFQMLAPMLIRCGCCGKETRNVKGMAVLRINPPANEPTIGMIPVGLCRKCLRTPNDNDLVQRVLKQLTGVDRVAKSWKGMLQ